MKTQKNNITKKRNPNKAFTLVELSIVLIIIGLLVGGVIGGSLIINAAKISSARSLTKSSPVFAVSNLELWLETTSKESFATENPDDATPIGTWNDLNPYSTIKNDAIEDPTNTGNIPDYTKDEINGLPAVKFNGSSDYLLANNLANVIAEPHTVFIVFERADTVMDESEMLLSWNTAVGHNEVLINVDNSPLGVLGHSDGGGNEAIINEDLRGQSVIATMVTDGSFVTTYKNGVGQTPLVDGLDSNPGGLFTIGAEWDASPLSVGNFLDGSIGEIIIYSRALVDDEKQDIETYLSKKWDIPVTF
jgi:prepilin-type N-terminal cleavage/methylation domain-containing protein